MRATTHRGCVWASLGAAFSCTGKDHPNGHIYPAIWSCFEGRLSWEGPGQNGPQEGLNFSEELSGPALQTILEQVELENATQKWPSVFGTAASIFGLCWGQSVWVLPSPLFWPLLICATTGTLWRWLCDHGHCYVCICVWRWLSSDNNESGFIANRHIDQ